MLQYIIGATTEANGVRVVAVERLGDENTDLTACLLDERCSDGLGDTCASCGMVGDVIWSS